MYVRRLGRQTVSTGGGGADHLRGFDLLLHLGDQDDGGEGVPGGL